jgi:small subunit ribosomal protein S20
VKEMANIKSAKKRIKVNQKKAAANKSRNTALKTAIKKANAAIEANAENKDELIKDAVKKIDQAASKNLIHKNCAARKKSNLAKKANNA